MPYLILLQVLPLLVPSLAFRNPSVTRSFQHSAHRHLHSSAAFSLCSLNDPICEYHTINIPTSQTGPPRQAISVEDLTPVLLGLLQNSSMTNGVIHVISRHTTTSITINERESRLFRDLQAFLLKLAPPDERSSSDARVDGVLYKHNDIHLRPDSDEEAQRCLDNGWNITDATQLQAWRDQEPINAHSHLLSMLLGSSECIPVNNGEMVLGQWQSVLLFDLDGPRDRTIGIQLMGYKSSE
ncbi:hypothetical protein MPSEU_000017300 [Mayamaea pseudoterrestris]|nr:hypothetical protein MPSEU_000017300 [Mayamaea pseudoterrestris]